ncbi:cytochrome c oxidase assembly factor CtaG [Bradyrhizobium sp. R2.2-H]|jgi:cytochrome c oxidase assembly factor CtaG|uniref:cytochrome c oxidase assembly protein n=1 Tax=unclassified Bradyrhizobium TaxID=2631580 RepID=UPI00104CBFC8|nr:MULTISPECIES: cytochrome c oxidase assembly protein [unclassified Bradyrhizobium]TCU69278.1 cytochrome c oxidase assembly factor CtaG [Bradyrhizobium sp. Y-H1]TCU70770.1 cytochrome c oxidase assembly factor CtaG [Bradyrhizobium sp. R2.2-H]
MNDPANDLDSVWSLCLASGNSVDSATIWSAWSIAPAVTVPLILFGAFYAAGAFRRAAEPHDSGALSYETTAAVAAMFLLAAAVVSPLCRLSAALASAHMIQHLVLVILAPQLIVVAAPIRTLGAGLSRTTCATSSNGRPEVQWNRPLLAAGAYGFLIWFWHAPATYELALTSAGWHLLYLGSLMLVSLWFWTCMVRARSTGAAALALLLTMVHTGLLGALLTFAPRPLYPIMSGGAIVFGLSPIEDQQLAGLIMWVPMGLIYLLSALLVISRGFSEQSMRQSSATTGSADWK